MGGTRSNYDPKQGGEGLVWGIGAVSMWGEAALEGGRARSAQGRCTRREASRGAAIMRRVAAAMSGAIRRARAFGGGGGVGVCAGGGKGGTCHA